MKILNFLFLGFLVLTFRLISTHPIDSNSYFVNSATLIEPDQYILQWNYTKTDITFKIVVKTIGWIGFGISPNGGLSILYFITFFTIWFLVFIWLLY
jgi:hypothetical protein